MANRHEYEVVVTWRGNRGTGTSGYRDFDRSMVTAAEGRPELVASADPHFRGDKGKWNPEQLLLASLSQCHLLWYLHLCAVAGVVVESYVDSVNGVMELTADGGGKFTEAVLRPKIVIAEESMRAKALALHADANAKCFIANSVNFPVRHEPEISTSRS
jgi:organic hydroperoxide reductase OsmC/OhrA